MSIATVHKLHSDFNYEYFYIFFIIVFMLTVALVQRYEDMLALRCALKVLFIIINNNHNACTHSTQQLIHYWW